MVLYDSSWQDWPDTGRSTGSYIVFYQGGTIDHCTHVTGPVDQYSTESEYNAECTAGTYLAFYRIINNEFLNNDIDVVP